MEFYKFGSEHTVKDILWKGESAKQIQTFKDDLEVLTDMVSKEPKKLGIVIVKYPRISYYGRIIEIIRSYQPGLELIYSKKTTFSIEAIKALYPDLLTDSTMLDLVTKLYSNLESILIVFKGQDDKTQQFLNELKKTNQDRVEKPGVIRSEIESVKYNPRVFELWKQRFFETNSAYLLARCYLLGRGIHTPDSNEEAINLLKKFIKST